MDLQTPVVKLPMVGPMYQKRLENLGIATVQDLLFHFPTRYEDFTVMSKIAALQIGEVVTVKGTITAIKNEFSRNRRFLQKATIEDETGNVDIIWFNQTYLTKTLPVGTKVSISGKVGFFKKRLTFMVPDFEIIYEDRETLHTGRLVPVYPETRGVSSKWLRAKIKLAIESSKNQFDEYLPKEIIEENNLLPFVQALTNVHFPTDLDIATKARQRLAFDEFFLMQVANSIRKKAWEEKRKGKSFHIATFKKQITAFWESLPFELTGAQKKAVNDIFKDLANEKPMNRLLEGDVGSGKTVVAAIAMYIAHLNGYESLLMAPTEILANQHYATINSLLSPLGVNVALITGSKKTKEDKTHMWVGTHALLHKAATIKKLGLVVVDEQHRFGVEHRTKILQKGNGGFHPHILTMTATPIPRTVALTMYGDLDLSVLDEMPKGRVQIKTWVVPEEKRIDAYAWISKQIEQERAQAFIICPFIEESETLDTVKAATKEFEILKEKIFKKQRLGLLHGKMKGKEKQEMIDAMRGEKLDILVATPVVEVGIDIPTATIILIEGSERFGLAQLHQLRGRVGRGDKQSYCLLFTSSESPTTLTRLKSLERTHVGARLAELDLKLRGPGDIHGTAQHGIPQLKIASFSDFPLIEKTSVAAKKLLKSNPGLSGLSFLQEKLKTYTIEAVELN